MLYASPKHFTDSSPLLPSYANHLAMKAHFWHLKNVSFKKSVKSRQFLHLFCAYHRCWSKSFASKNLINHNTMITVANCYYLTFWCLWWAKELLVICHSIEPAQNNETEAICWAGLAQLLWDNLFKQLGKGLRHHYRRSSRVLYVCFPTMLLFPIIFAQ